MNQLAERQADLADARAALCATVLQGQGVWMYECVNMTVCSGNAEQQSCTSGWQYRFVRHGGAGHRWGRALF